MTSRIREIIAIQDTDGKMGKALVRTLDGVNIILASGLGIAASVRLGWVPIAMLQAGFAGYGVDLATEGGKDLRDIVKSRLPPKTKT